MRGALFLVLAALCAAATVAQLLLAAVPGAKLARLAPRPRAAVFAAVAQQPQGGVCDSCVILSCASSLYVGPPCVDAPYNLEATIQ